VSVTTIDMKVVFLDETRSMGYSWLLTVTRGHPRAGSPVEADPNTFKVLGAPPTSAAVVKQ
jgi:hypothetical protein